MEVYTTQSGLKSVRFTIAINRQYKNKQGVWEADFIPVICWRELAELCEKYLQKGKKVCVQGSVQTRSFDAKDGTKRYVTEVVASNVEFLSRNDNKDEEQAAPAEEGPTEMVPNDDDGDLPF